MPPDISSIKDIYPFKSNYLRIKGYSYHYVDEGAGEPIVMLHGNPTWSFLFRNLILGLRGKWRAIAPDHLGCGLSDKPRDFQYRLETHIDNFEEFVLSLKLENITLLMHDWGGPIGMGFAVRYPERIKRLVFSNTAAFSMKRIPLRLAACRIPWLGRKMIVDMNLFSRAATVMTSRKGLDEKVKQGYLLPYDSPENRIAVYNFVKDIPLGPEDPSYEILLGIEHGLWMFRELPIAMVWGMKDWCFSPAFLKKWLRFYPFAEVLRIRNAGHFVFEDAPEESLEFIRDFMSK